MYMTNVKINAKGTQEKNNNKKQSDKSYLTFQITKPHLRLTVKSTIIPKKLW